MRKILILFSIFLALSVKLCLAVSEIEPISKGERILIIAPHPDDETIGCGGVIQQAKAQGAEVRVVYLTNGDHNQISFIVYEKRLTLRKSEFIHMGEVRRAEAVRAMQLLGIGEDKLVFLGYPDFGTFSIFSRYWQTKKPYKSFLTRISSVPYKKNLSFGSAYVGESILSDIEKVLYGFRPNKIFVSSPLDTNADHKAAYLFLQVALSDLSKEIPNPKIYPYLVHCVGWPLPRHFHPELGLEPPKSFLNTQVNWMKFSLTKEQLGAKYKAILSYNSQTQSSAFYLLSFARKNELFGYCTDIELKRQASSKEKAVTFFGYSDMYPDSDAELFGNLENLIQPNNEVSYAVVDDSILIHIKKAGRLGRKFGFQIYLFGCNKVTPFAAMPKISIITRLSKFRIFDAGKMIKPAGVTLEADSDSCLLRVPLQVLGKPDFVLVSIKAYAGLLPLDTLGFRKVVIK